MFVDLHIHSYFSDGAQTPEQAALACRDSGVGLAALCDHNNWLGCERFAAACEDLGVIAIRGVEFDCRWQGYHLHILGYGFTPTPELAELSHRCRELLLQMSVDLVERMAPEYPQLSPREYRDFRYDTLLGGWAGLHYLHQKGVTGSPEEGMPLYARYGLDYTAYPFPAVEEVIAALLRADGIPVLAHPCNYFSGCELATLYTNYTELCALGLGGIEAYYPGQSKTFSAQTALFCEKKGLLITSGSDSHGLFGHLSGSEQFQIGRLMMEPNRLRLGRLLPPELHQ